MYVRPYLEDPILLEPDYTDEFDRVHHDQSNETPMYVRPYLEDPIFLQPDDGEVSLLHPDLSKQAAEKEEHHDVDSHHDLSGDPSLEHTNDFLPDAWEEESKFWMGGEQHHARK